MSAGLPWAERSAAECAEEIARLRRRMRRVHPDGGQRAFIPDSRDAVGSGGVEGELAADQKQQGTKEQRLAGFGPDWGMGRGRVRE